MSTATIIPAERLALLRKRRGLVAQLDLMPDLVLRPDEEDRSGLLRWPA